jgi:hypothetical protein
MACLSMWITVASVLAAFEILPVVPQIPRQGQVGMGRDSMGGMRREAMVTRSPSI